MCAATCGPAPSKPKSYQLMHLNLVSLTPRDGGTVSAAAAHQRRLPHPPPHTLGPSSTGSPMSTHTWPSGKSSG